jgi:LPXTG-motif cell wall-anchored protein
MNTKFLRFAETTAKQILALLVVATFMLMPFAGVDGVLADHDPFDGAIQTNVTICHFNSGQGGSYNANTVSISSSGAPQGGHEGHANDIIPPYHWSEGSYPGSANWDSNTEAIWNNGGCDGDGVLPDPEIGILTLVKEVVNDNGGTATTTDWTLSAVGATTTISGNSGDAEITDAVVEVGDYDLSESGGPTGYTASDWDCGDATIGTSTVTVGTDDDIICTITNDDDLIPPTPTATSTLTLIKEVLNDNGGNATTTDWTLTATGSTTIEGVTGSMSVTDAEVESGDYVLSEDGPTGYTASDWECNAGEGDFTLTNGELTLEEGDVVSCTITNDDVPPGTGTIVVQKLTGDVGTTTAFEFTSDTLLGNFSLFGETSTSTVENLGTYSVSETVSSGWNLDSAVCVYDDQATSTPSSIILDENGETVTCTFNNSEESPRTADIFGMKWNDENGDSNSSGETGLEGWLISLFNGDTLIATTTTDGSGNYTFDDIPENTGEEEYTVCEEDRNGWSQTFPASGAACDNGTTGYSFFLASGQDMTDLDFGNMEDEQPSGDDDDDDDNGGGGSSGGRAGDDDDDDDGEVLGESTVAGINYFVPGVGLPNTGTGSQANSFATVAVLVLALGGLFVAREKLSLKS